ncbi:hypothetical protein [Pseudarthrobacter sulfonivorans]|nr:hypothetical protein [Pseudarthrobacter sulfonivorans]
MTSTTGTGHADGLHTLGCELKNHVKLKLAYISTPARLRIWPSCQ